MSWNKKYKDEDLKLIPSKPILSDFGKAIDVEDRVELYVYPRDGGNILFANTDIETYKVAEGGILDDGTITQDSVVFLDLHNDIREFVSSGTFIVKYNFFRTLVGTPDDGVNDLFLDEISASRKEIRLKISKDATQVEKEIFEDFGDKLSIRGDVDHWVDVHVNFGNGVVPLAVNWQLDKVGTPDFPYSIVLKLYEPLPEEIEVKAPCWIVQEMITPVQETVYVESPEIEKEINILGPANFNAGDDDHMGGGTTGYETWNTLTSAKESVLNKILNNYFSGSMDQIRMAIDYRKFEHFVRFGSAEERLKNFRYKLQQIEYYDDKIASLSYNSPASGTANFAITGSTAYQTSIESFKVLRNDIIAHFDGYEKHLYNESASYVSSSLGEFWPTTWPKQSDINYPKSPYECLSVTSSEAIDWYDGAIYSASMYDRHNVHSLENTAIPLHVHQDPSIGGEETINDEYVKFVNMVGQFYDDIYLYVSAIPELWDRHNVLDARLIEGQFSGSDMLSKDLLYVALQSLGFSQCNPSSGEDLWTYILGTDADGNYGNKLITENIGDWGYWNSPDDKFANEDYVDGLSPFNQTKIYASDWYQTSHSVAREDVKLEYSKRILNNLPHLMKTKGTLEGLKAYMNIYGVPQTLFKIRECTGVMPLDYFSNHYYDYDYYSYALSFNGNSCLTGSWDKVTDATIKADNGNREQYPDTIELRFKIPDMMMHNLKCGKLDINEVENNANKKDMCIIQINSSSFVSVEHASKLPSGSETYSFSTKDNSKYGRMHFALGVNDGTFQYPSYYLSCSTDWAPIYDGDWWNVMVRRNSPTSTTVPSQILETFTYELFCKKSSDWSKGQITHEFSASMTQNGSTTVGKLANISWNSDGFDDDQYVSASFYTPENIASDYSLGYTEGHFGTNYDSFFIGGNVDSSHWGINRHPSMSLYNYSGSVQELRFWMKPLTESAFNNHVYNPMAIDGNTYTSSYSDLIGRWSLGADLKTYEISTGSKISSSHPNQDIMRPFSGERGVYLTSSGFTDRNDFEFQYEKVATIVPNYIGLQAKEKIRIEENALENGRLSRTKKSSISARDRHPKDENRVSVQLTPVDQINIDIEHQLGGIEFNDLVGDPRARYMEFYPDVVYYDNHYWLKHFGPFQYGEFFRLIKYYDGAILCQLKKSIPGRTKPDFNIAVEPHILERPRFAWRQPDIEHVQWEGSMSVKPYVDGNTTELGRFKHSGPGDPFYNDWDNTGHDESRYGDRVDPGTMASHRWGDRTQAHILPPLFPSYGTGGQRQREKNPTSLYKTTVGEIEANVKNDPYAPLILDNIFNCWERDQHAPFAARYEWMLPIFWSGSFGSYYNYTVSSTTAAATPAATELHISGTWPGDSTGFMNGTEIILTSTNGNETTLTVGDGRTAQKAKASIIFPDFVKADWEDEGVAALHSTSIYIADTSGSYWEFNTTGSLTQTDGTLVSSSTITLAAMVEDLKTQINNHASFSAQTGSNSQGSYDIFVTQSKALNVPSFEFLADGTYIGYDAKIMSGSLLTANIWDYTSGRGENWTSEFVTSSAFTGGQSAIAAVGGASFTYTSTNATLATRVRTAIHSLSDFTCGTVRNSGTDYVIPVTQSTAGENGNTYIKGNFFGPWNKYYPEYGYIDTHNRISGSALDPGAEPAPFAAGKDSRTYIASTLIQDTTLSVVTQSNPYWERDAVSILSHPMDPREDEKWYDFNKQEYVDTNLLPNKKMTVVNRPTNFPILNNGLTSYADQRSCRDRGKEWFFPFIGNHRESFYKYTETHRFATELSRSLGKPIPHHQFGQASFGYGNLSGESIVSHSGADIMNLAATSPMSRSAQYQDWRPKGIMNLIYDGCMMSASDFNVDSPQTVDGGPVVEIIDTTPFVLTAAEPTLGEGPGIVQGEGVGRGVGKYSGRPIDRRPAAGKDPVIRGGGRDIYRDTSRDPIGGRGGRSGGRTGRGRGLNYVYRDNPGGSAPTNTNWAV